MKPGQGFDELAKRRNGINDDLKIRSCVYAVVPLAPIRQSPYVCGAIHYSYLLLISIVTRMVIAAFSNEDGDAASLLFKVEGFKNEATDVHELLCETFGGNLVL